MLDDENDKRIKEAADNYHPEYDDTAWEKMEQLLDEHLPVEKERKRLLFLIPTILIIGCLLLLIGLYNWKNNKPGSSENLASKNKIEKAIVTDQPNDSKKLKGQPSLESKKIVEPITKEKKDIEKNNANSVPRKPVNTRPVPSSASPRNRNVVSVIENDLPAKKNDELKEEDAIAKTNNHDEINQGKKSISKNPSQENKSNVLTPAEKENKVDEEKSSPEKEMIGQDDIAKTKKVTSENISEKTKKTSQGFANNFGVSISVGPDISGVHDNKIGKLTLAYGAGISYTISKRLNLRTGFYFSKKIYSVSPDDYRLPSASPNYEYLKNVNANCAVYEIPVKLDYSFGKTKNHNWFVSGGLSSYLMKKESYDYNYKTPAGQTYNKDWSISNKNKHFFSVLSISGGYQYSFNKQFSIIAEPYVNLPLTGIGAGKVKLNSGGILFTIKAKPFLKSH